VLLPELDLVVVAKSEPWSRRNDDETWKPERATLNLIGKFVRSLSGRQGTEHHFAIGLDKQIGLRAP